MSQIITILVFIALPTEYDVFCEDFPATQSLSSAPYVVSKHTVSGDNVEMVSIMIWCLVAGLR